MNNICKFAGGGNCTYSAPEIEVTAVEVEQGFAQSEGSVTPTWDDLLKDDPISWGVNENTQFE